MTIHEYGDRADTQRHLEEVEHRLASRGFLHEEPSSYAEGVHDAIEAVTQEFVIEDIEEAADRR